MKTLEVIARLVELENEKPGMDVLIDKGGLFHIDEIGVDTNDTGIILWPEKEAIEQ